MNQNVKKIVKIGGLSIFFLLIIIYAFFRSKDLIFGVKIRNVDKDGKSAQSGATIMEGVI